ncbi:MAG: ATP synthase F1 subunit delta [Candidatus Firestonebacteria bacterium]
MLAKSIGKKYALAFYGIAEEKNSVDSCRTALFNFADALKKEAFNTFGNPRFSFAEKQALLRKSFVKYESAVPSEFVNLLCLLIEKKRFEFLPEIREGFKDLYDAKHGFREAEVKSAFPVPADQREKIRQALEKRYNGKFLVEYFVDPELIGGLVITIGNEMIDGSLRNRLSKIRTLLLK